MKITLVRHGQTESNYQGLLQGTQNECLNDTGRRQCQRLREKLINEHYDVCYMSPLVRCVETAFILIGERVEMIPDKRLVERGFGELDGKPRKLYDSLKYWNYDKNCSDLGVEPVQALFKRCSEFLDYILEKHKGKDILIVSHGATCRALRHLLLNHDLKGNLLDMAFGNCYCEEIEVREDNKKTRKE